MNVVLFAAAALFAADSTSTPFAIEVVDDQTGRGVPVVELTTTSGVTFVTDSAGMVAFHEPALMNQRVFFHVRSHGYEFRRDGFGMRGIALDVTPGGSAQIKIKRLNIAERLYRVTGEGIYRDSVLLGRQPPTKQPLLNAKVTGCDSVQNAIYRGRLYWFWGDTNWPAYPLGLFHTPGATSRLPADGLDPSRGVDLEYFVGENGFARAAAKMPGDGPTWIDGLAVLKDSDGRERLFAAFAKVRPPLTVYRRGICEWSDEKQEFEKVIEYEPDQPLIPFGHPVVRRAAGDETDYVYFGDPFPFVRVRATVDDFQQLKQYEGYVQNAWQRGVKANPAAELVQLRDVATKKNVRAHRGTVSWNAYRKKWIAIFVEEGGTSYLGEVWFAEADSPQGPWADCVKIVTHDKYSFYNPKQHPYFDQDGGRVIYFEGTYTHTFSGNEHKTPRYDYNQIMYRLDLADERLRLPGL
jgi:hypothetical protein